MLILEWYYSAKIRTISYARDLWKSNLSCKQLRLLCSPDLLNLPDTVLLSGFQSFLAAAHQFRCYRWVLFLTLIRHDGVIKWKHFPRYWPFVRGIHQWPMNSPHKGQWRGALMFSLICLWIYGWINNREAGDFRRRRVHYNVTVILYFSTH